MSPFARAQGKSAEPVSVARARPVRRVSTLHLAGVHEKQQNQLPLRRSLKAPSDRRADVASDSPNPVATRVHPNFAGIPIHASKSPAIPSKQALREPVAPLSLAADAGVAFEDEAAQQSVLLPDDELAERALDLQAAADKRREAVGGTDIATGKLDEKALTAIDEARGSVARKQKVKSKANNKKTKSRNKNKKVNDPALSGPSSSRDLSIATDDQVDDHLHQLRKAEILAPDAEERERLRREIENVQGEKDTRTAAAAAERKAQAEALTHQINELRDRIESLKQHAVAVNDLRNSTSSLITGPTHFWGGAWTELEPGDFASANMYLGQAANAVSEDNLQYAQYLLAQSEGEYHDLTSRFGNYMDGIERGVNRSVAVLKVAKTAGRVAASEFDPTGGFLYGSVQDLSGQGSEVFHGQRESIDGMGILKDNLINTAVSGVAGYGASAAGKAASPYLSQLGRFGGLAQSALGYTTNTAISSELTGTSFVDNLTDPGNLVAHVVGERISASKAQTEAAGAKPLAAPTPEAFPAPAGGTGVPALAAAASPVVHALPDLVPQALPGTAAAATPAVPSAAVSSMTHLPEPPSTAVSSSHTRTQSPEPLTGPKPNPTQGESLSRFAMKPTGEEAFGTRTRDRVGPTDRGKGARPFYHKDPTRQAPTYGGSGAKEPPRKRERYEPAPVSGTKPPSATEPSLPAKPTSDRQLGIEPEPTVAVPKITEPKMTEPAGSALHESLEKIETTPVAPETRNSVRNAINRIRRMAKTDPAGAQRLAEAVESHLKESRSAGFADRETQDLLTGQRSPGNAEQAIFDNLTDADVAQQKSDEAAKARAAGAQSSGSNQGIPPLAERVNFGQQENGRATGVTGEIYPSDLHTGTETKDFYPQGLEKGELDPLGARRGHLLGNLFGGSGTDPRNLAWMHKRINNSQFKIEFENPLRSTLQNEGGPVKLSVRPRFRGNENAPYAVEVWFQGPKTTVGPKTILTPGLGDI
jgi:DNA/RNA non-specific endonuclease